MKIKQLSYPARKNIKSNQEPTQKSLESGLVSRVRKALCLRSPTVKKNLSNITPNSVSAKVQALKKSKRSYKLEGGLLYYPSKNVTKRSPEVDLNCKFHNARGNLIECRHLALVALNDLNLKSSEYSVFSSEEGLRTIKNLKDNTYEDDGDLQGYIFEYADNYIFDLNNLGELIHRLAEPLILGGSKECIFMSDNHVMSFGISLKKMGSL